MNTGGVRSFSTASLSGSGDYDDNTPVQSGYAVVTPTAGDPAAMVVFETFGLKSGNDTTPAGILAPAMTTNAVLFSSSSARLSRNLGVAIVNPGVTTANVVLTLRGADGSIMATKTLSISPRQQTAQFVSQLFAVTQDITGSLSITSNIPIAAVGLRFRGSLFSTLPVTSLSAAAPVPQINSGVGGAGAVILPQFATGGGWASEIDIVNKGTGTLTVRLDLYKQDGTPLTTARNSTSGSSFTGLVVPGGGVITLVPRDNGGDSRF